MLGFLTWDLNPIFLQLGPLQIRYYGVMFALTIYTGFWVWQRQALRNRESLAFAEEFLWYGVVAIVGGARLGHCLFYEPLTYLGDLRDWTVFVFTHPLDYLSTIYETIAQHHPSHHVLPAILRFWEGGLASHGATVGLIVALWLFARKHKTTWFRVSDYLAPGIAIAAGGVRVGNFLNSEIVGRVTDVPWGVQFLRYCQMEGIPAAQCAPRHPSQVYEFMMGVITYFVLMAVQKADIRRAGSGLMGGVFMTVYFSFRFLVEFFKEFQTEQLRTEGPLGAIEQSIGYHFTMGQWLSVIPVAVGLWMIARAMMQKKEDFAPPLSVAEVNALMPAARAEAEAHMARKASQGKRKGKK
jgi:phosphatidylglycerol:prolipoprotein diacylglycerol transferase